MHERRMLLSEHLRNSEPALRAACRRHPESYALHSSLVELLGRNGRRGAALVVWKRGMRRFERMPNPWFQRAHWAIESKDLDEAQRLLRVCLSRDRGYFRDTARFWRAEALWQLRRLDEAAIELAKVPEGYEECWSPFNYELRSKIDLASDIDDARPQHAAQQVVPKDV